MSKFITVGKTEDFTFKDRGSKFIGRTHRVNSKEHAEETVKQVWLKHPKARHVCYAYIVNESIGLYRANDDGEPSGSAGVPILNQIRSADLRYTLITVVRYFGGTKLGVPGLINAYKTAATGAVEQSEQVEDFEKSVIKIRFDYPIMEGVMKQLKKHNLNILQSDYAESCNLEIEIPSDTESTHVSYFEQLGVKILT